MSGGKPIRLYHTQQEARDGVKQMEWNCYFAIYEVAFDAEPIKVYESFGKGKCHSTEQLTRLSVSGTMCSNQQLCRIYKKNEDDVTESFWS